MLDQLESHGRTPEILYADTHYGIRGGGESVKSGLKQRMGMGRLRGRGSPRVRMTVLLRCAGWNVLRALHAFRKGGIGDFMELRGRFARLARTSGA